MSDITAFPGNGWNEGMTLRDFFAAQAMSAAITALNGPGSLSISRQQSSLVAEYSYQMADALIMERDK